MIKNWWVGALALVFCFGVPAHAELAATNRPMGDIHITPGPDDGRVAFYTAGLLQKFHFSHHRLDPAFASQFMDLYLEALDPQHLHFLQTDLDYFERYRTNLTRLTITSEGKSDVTPAFDIFSRFIERLKQRVAYANDLLQHEKFEFKTDERVALNRRELPYPQDMEEAHKLWNQRLRFEYLQEKLGLDNAKYAKTAGTNLNIHSVGFPDLQEKPGLDNSKYTKPAGTNINVFSVDLHDTAGVDVPGQIHAALTNHSENLQKKPGSTYATKTKPAETNAVKTVHEQIVNTLTHRYQRSLRVFADWNNQDVMGVYLTALAHVYDPHSDYFNKETLDQFTINMNLALFGIGAQLRADDEGYCKIEKLLPGGPAEKGKQLKPGDRIVAVAQTNQPPVDVIEMSLNKTVQMIRGPKGTEVRLTVIPERASSPRTVISIIRDEIPLADSAAKGKIIELPGNNGETNRLGVVNLPSFYAPIGPTAKTSKDSTGEFTSVDVAKLLKKFKSEKVGGIILDLRYNGGGSLEEAIRLAGLFIKEGPIVQVRTSDGRGNVFPDPDSSCLYDGPLLVLTSRFSASASEIVAAALQDYGRALVVGDISTHGKGTVQSVNYLNNFMTVENPEKSDPGALKVTVQKFYRTSGISTQLKGVLPDIVLPSIWNYSKDVGESALENPLPCDTIESANYDKLNLVQPFLGDLLKHTSERLETNTDYTYVREDIEKFRKQQEDKTISLNEALRRKEMVENDAREKARKKERLSRKDPAETVYEISLKQANLPGLPAPVQKTNTLAMKTDGLPHAKTGLVGIGATADPAAEVEATEDAPPARDAGLDEAGHILLDYISLLQKRGLVTANQPQP